MSTSKIIAFIYAFMYIYMPIFLLPFNVIHILTIIAYMHLLTIYINEFVSMLKDKLVLSFIGMQFFLLAYALILKITTGAEIGFVYTTGAVLFEVVPCALFIAIHFAKKFNSNENDVLKLLAALGGAQFILFLFSLYLPIFRDVFTMGIWGGVDLDSEFQNSFGTFRVFGVARGYTFAMPLFVGVCIIAVVILGRCIDARYYLCVIPFVIIALFNSRLALISLPLVLVFGLLIRGERERLQYFIFGLVVVVIISALMSYILAIYESGGGEYNWLAWIARGIEETIAFVTTGERVRNFEALDTMIHWPSGVDFLIGTGINTFTSMEYNSDSGYVMNMYFGGLIFSAVLYISYLFLAGIVYKSKVEWGKALCLSIIFLLFLSNVKGNVFRLNEITNGFVMISFMILAAGRNIGRRRI